MKIINLILAAALSTQVSASNIVDWCKDIDNVIYNNYKSSDLLPIDSNKKLVNYKSKIKSLPIILDTVCGAQSAISFNNSFGLRVDLNMKSIFKGYNEYVHLLVENEDKKMLTKLALFVSRPKGSDMQYYKEYVTKKYAQYTLFNVIQTFEKNQKDFLSVTDIIINNYCFNNEEKDPTWGGRAMVWNDFLVSLSTGNYTKVEKILNRFSKTKNLYSTCNTIVNF